MTRLRSKNSKLSAQALLRQLNDHVDMDDLRSRATKAATTAHKRGRKAAHDAPSAAELAKQARNSRVADTVITGAAALLPVVSGAVSEAMQRKSVRKAVRHAPMVASRSVAKRGLFAMGGVGAALGVGLIARSVWKRYAASRVVDDVTGGQASLDDALGRMDDEGPTPGAYDGEPSSIATIARDGGSTPRRVRS